MVFLQYWFESTWSDMTVSWDEINLEKRNSRVSVKPIELRKLVDHMCAPFPWSLLLLSSWCPWQKATELHQRWKACLAEPCAPGNKLPGGGRVPQQPGSPHHTLDLGVWCRRLHSLTASKPGRRCVLTCSPAGERHLGEEIYGAKVRVFLGIYQRLL